MDQKKFRVSAFRFPSTGGQMGRLRDHVNALQTAEMMSFHGREQAKRAARFRFSRRHRFPDQHPTTNTPLLVPRSAVLDLILYQSLHFQPLLWK